MKRLLGIAFILGLAGCGGGESVSLVGKSSTEAADEASAAICGKGCDDISLECTPGQNSGDPPTCVGTLEPVDEAECMAETKMDFEAMWDCADDDQKGRLETCLNDQLDQDCPDQADADAYADSAESGDLSDGDFPPSCAVIFELIEGCEQPS